MITNFVEVTFKCACMPKEASTKLPIRRADETLHEWVNGVLGAGISIAHRLHSPECRSTVMEYVKVPIDDQMGAIGGHA